MISALDVAPKFKAGGLTFGQECANVLVQRNLISEANNEQVAEVIGRFANMTESATKELTRRRLIAEPNEAIVTEFIRRTVRRFSLKSNGVSGDTLSRILGVDRSVARRIVNGTRSLTAENVKTLSAKIPGCKGLSST